MNPWILHSAGLSETVNVLEYYLRLVNVSIMKNQALRGKRNLRLPVSVNSNKELAPFVPEGSSY
jgi:hypothetical protein